MNSHFITDILNHPNENGVTIFILGVLFIYQFIIFYFIFSTRIGPICFIVYIPSLLFIGLLNRPQNGFITFLIEPFRNFLDHISLNLILVYNLVYIIFASKIVDLKSHSLKWYTFFYWAVLCLISYAILLEILYLITGNLTFIIKGHLPFSILSYIIGILFFIPLIRIKNPLKYYLIIGATFLVLTSLVVSIIKRLDINFEEKEIRYSIFYLGVVIENLFFSLALGHKQKIILDQRNESQTKLIAQLKDNEILQEKVEEQLQKNIEVLSKQAEIERLEKLQVANDKELAELKISALRSQMNPHFIFNSLNSIKRYIIDNEKKMQFII